MKARAELKLTSADALIVVDMQNDFITGALAVPGAADIVGVVNQYVQLFEKAGLCVFYTRDWHSEDHCSFLENGGRWPRHCVRNTEGAMFHKKLYFPKDLFFIVSKGTDPGFDAYSGFQGTNLESLLRERGVKRVFVCGLATDYCVKHTCLGAVNLGFQCFVLLDAVKGVDLSPGDSERALEELYSAGVVGVILG